MAERESTVGSASVDEAINRVLTAERGARVAVAECRRQALVVLEDAREQARRIEVRAEGRISAVSSLADCSIRQKIAGIEAEAAALTEQPDLSDDQLKHLDRVIDDLIGELLGAPE